MKSLDGIPSKELCKWNSLDGIPSKELVLGLILYPLAKAAVKE